MIENFEHMQPDVMPEETVIDQTPAEQEPIQQQPQQDSPNFRALREKAERIARERDELARQLEQERAKKSAIPDEDFSVNLADDEIAEGKHLSKVQKKIKQLEQQIQQYHHQTYQTAVEAKLRSEYPDIEQVVSRENLEELAAKNPALAQTLNATPDLYNKAVAAYSIIKGLNIGQQAAPAPYNDDKERAARNVAKPRTAAYVSPQQGESPLSKANLFAEGLSESVKKQLWTEMQQAIKGA